MRAALVLVLFAAGAAPAPGGERLLKVTAARGLPAAEAVTVYRQKDGKREAVATATKFEKPLPLPGDGPFEVWVTFKGGVAVKAPGAVAVKAGTTHDLELGDAFGAVEVFGDIFPRAAKVVLTDARDPGPDEKGHAAVQVASDYRVAMCAPPGVYAVWVVPANGAKAQRVENSVRVQAGRSVRVGD